MIAGEYTIALPPKPVGFWKLYHGGAQATWFAMYHKPTPGQIKSTEEMLGWGWIDADEHGRPKDRCLTCDGQPPYCCKTPVCKEGGK